MTVALAFTPAEADDAYDAWRFNCGPGALCAVTGAKPEDALRVLPQFKERGYTNPKMMRAGLKALGRSWTEPLSEESENRLLDLAELPAFGLVRVQWGGRWTNPGVPIRARYRHTHWAAVDGQQVFDINAVHFGGWVPVKEWAEQLIPWLMRECAPKATGWWITHSWEVVR